MNRDYMLACGILWHKACDPEAGWELIEGLNSSDPEVRSIARRLLLENGDESMRLLECALATGEVSLDAACSCMAEILRVGEGRQINKSRLFQLHTDS
jgi:HEAT repeat protein